MVKPKNDRNLIQKDGRWHIDFTFRGKRIRQLGGYTKEQARNALAKLRIELLNERLGFKKAGGDPVPFDAFADEFLEVYCKQNKRSWKRDEILLDNLKRYFSGRSLQGIGSEDVERFKAGRRAERVKHYNAKKSAPISPATVNRELTCLKTLFNKAEEWGRIEKNPIRRVRRLKEANARERILSAGEAHRLLRSASNTFRPVLIVALNTGMRRSEILGLRWTNVDLVRGYINIEDSKSGRGRKVPVNSAVMEALAVLPRKGEYVFPGADPTKPVQDVKTAFHAACRKAKTDLNDEDDPGITGVRFHDLRHTAASKMVEAGVDLVTVSKVLGHASIQTTMRYCHPTPENMRRAVERLGEIMDPSRQKVDTVKIKRLPSDSIRYN